MSRTFWFSLSIVMLTVGCASGGPAAPAEPISPQPPVQPAPLPDPPAIQVPLAPDPETTPSIVNIDTVRAGQFDDGKMWTFEYPPTDYLAKQYNFTPDVSWYERARLSALRIPNCSASFVSPNGLVMTNHHCARESVSQVSRDGETLLDDGFYATTLEEERPVEDFTADQLVEIQDVSAEVDAALANVADIMLSTVRDSVTEAIAERLMNERGGEDGGYEVEVISLWNGAKTSAYIFRRYTDVRLVLAPELKMGFFGGDPDNFTYPRYSLDMSFFRVYDDDGQPLRPTNYFAWDTAGASDGDLVFIIGNPGSTNRLQTVAQLEHRRQVADRAILDFITSRIDVMQAYYDVNPDVGEQLDLRNTIFSLLNSQKAYTGMWNGLHDPVLMAKRRDSERQFRQALEQDAALQGEYGDLLGRMAEIQEQKTALADGQFAFAGFGAPDFTSAVVLRTLFGYQYLVGSMQGADQETLDGLSESLLEVPEQPVDLQVGLLAARIEDFRVAWGDDDQVVRQILQGQTPTAAARRVVMGSIFADSAKSAAALGSNALPLQDAGIAFFESFLQRFAQFQGQLFGLQDQEDGVADRLGRARFAVYGTARPPDATFSLRIADGVVRGYDYNGTVAPTHTTFYGLYDRHFSNPGREEWDLPSRWLNPPDGFDLSTPMNFVSTVDIIGGNSGSPVVNQDLEIVGLVFDGNIESLPGDYIYTDERNRSVAVDARGILAALDHLYDADRIFLELTTGRLFRTETEADRAPRN